MVNVIKRQCIDICVLKWISINQNHPAYVALIKLTFNQRRKKFLIR